MIPILNNNFDNNKVGKGEILYKNKLIRNLIYKNFKKIDDYNILVNVESIFQNYSNGIEMIRDKVKSKSPLFSLNNFTLIFQNIRKDTIENNIFYKNFFINYINVKIYQDIISTILLSSNLLALKNFIQVFKLRNIKIKELITNFYKNEIVSKNEVKYNYGAIKINKTMIKNKGIDIRDYKDIKIYQYIITTYKNEFSDIQSLKIIFQFDPNSFLEKTNLKQLIKICKFINENKNKISNNKILDIINNKKYQSIIINDLDTQFQQFTEKQLKSKISLLFEKNVSIRSENDNKSLLNIILNYLDIIYYLSYFDNDFGNKFLLKFSLLLCKNNNIKKEYNQNNQQQNTFTNNKLLLENLKKDQLINNIFNITNSSLNQTNQLTLNKAINELLNIKNLILNHNNSNNSNEKEILIDFKENLDYYITQYELKLNNKSISELIKEFKEMNSGNYKSLEIFKNNLLISKDFINIKTTNSILQLLSSGDDTNIYYFESLKKKYPLLEKILSYYIFPYPELVSYTIKSSTTIGYYKRYYRDIIFNDNNVNWIYIQDYEILKLFENEITLLNRKMKFQFNDSFLHKNNLKIEQRKLIIYDIIGIDCYYYDNILEKYIRAHDTNKTNAYIIPKDYQFVYLQELIERYFDNPEPKLRTITTFFNLYDLKIYPIYKINFKSKFFKWFFENYLNERVQHFKLDKVGKVIELDAMVYNIRYQVKKVITFQITPYILFLALYHHGKYDDIMKLLDKKQIQLSNKEIDTLFRNYSRIEFLEKMIQLFYKNVLEYNQKNNSYKDDEYFLSLDSIINRFVKVSTMEKNCKPIESSLSNYLIYIKLYLGVIQVRNTNTQVCQVLNDNFKFYQSLIKLNNNNNNSINSSPSTSNFIK